MQQNEFLFSDSGKSPAKKSINPKPKPEKKEPKVYSVTQISQLIKMTLDDHLPKKFLLEGEISNFKHHVSGHLYFTLKDDNAQIPGVMWKSSSGKLKFKPKDGMAVIATGRVDVYPPHGKYQFVIDKLEPSGLGALELAFRQLAQKLHDEGLFDDEYKKEIPAIPETIAIISATGSAALEDIKKTLHRRYPIVRKLFYPVAVQGDGAAKQIAKAIKDINRISKNDPIDTIILARGGGSIEDLWAFNEEVVARAIYDSKIPIISGIGHEVDVTIADMVADLRAATPTAAAEMAVPLLEDLTVYVDNAAKRLSQLVNNQLEQYQLQLQQLSHRGFFNRPKDLIHYKEQTLDQYISKLSKLLINQIHESNKQLEASSNILKKIEPGLFINRAKTCVSEQEIQLNNGLEKFIRECNHTLEQQTVRLRSSSPKQRLEQQNQLLNITEKRLVNLNPKKVLNRGYSITRDSNGRILTQSYKPKDGDILKTELADDTIIESQIIKNKK